MTSLTVQNQQPFAIGDIPILSVKEFEDSLREILQTQTRMIGLFGLEATESHTTVIAVLGNSSNSALHLLGTTFSPANNRYHSFADVYPQTNYFECELAENHQIIPEGHPWLRPVRKQTVILDNQPYSMYKMEGEEVHEVAVGPIHAGVIEPGHFRFQCHGELVYHLEILLGYQHRGIEQMFLEKKKLLQRTTIAESIAGDSVVGHTTAFSQLWESLCGYKVSRDIEFARTIALEMERMAVHTGDLSGVCTDIAYQLGSSVFGRLRTPIINYMQEWCGNRLSKGLVRPGRNQFPLTPELAHRLVEVLDVYEPDFLEMNEQMFQLPSVLSRFERTGVLSYDDVLSIGTVGMAARMSGLSRDIRSSHPFGLYPEIGHQPIIKHHGDVYSRVQIRKAEVKQSMQYIRDLIQNVPEQDDSEPNGLIAMNLDVFSTEGGRRRPIELWQSARQADFLTAVNACFRNFS